MKFPGMPWSQALPAITEGGSRESRGHNLNIQLHWNPNKYQITKCQPAIAIVIDYSALKKKQQLYSIYSA